MTRHFYTRKNMTRHQNPDVKRRAGFKGLTLLTAERLNDESHPDTESLAARWPNLAAVTTQRHSSRLEAEYHTV
jgi:hypothetical protein